MPVIFMVIILSSEKTRASYLRTANVTQKKTFASFLFKRFYIHRTGKIWSSLWKAEICSGLKCNLFPCVNFLTNPLFSFSHET